MAVLYKRLELVKVCSEATWLTDMKLEIAWCGETGISRLSSVTMLQLDRFVLSTNLFLKINVSLPLVTEELLQKTVDVTSVTYKLTTLLRSETLILRNKFVKRTN